MPLGARAQLVLSALAVFVTVGVVEVAFRATAGTPSIRPGLTPVELRWKLEHTTPAESVYVVGDSRVGWGFAEAAFDRVLEDPFHHGVNTSLPAASTAKILGWLLDRFGRARPGALVVNFSPGGWYAFTEDIGEAGSFVNRQDVLDARIVARLSEHVFTFHREPGVLTAHFLDWLRYGRRDAFYWTARISFPDGFVQGRLGSTAAVPANPLDVELIGHSRMLERIFSAPAETRAARDSLVQRLSAAKNAGWTVVLVRFPVGRRMLAMESTLPPALGPESVAAELAIPYFDYTHDARTRGLSVPDESHLSPDGARRMASILAEDVRPIVR